MELFKYVQCFSLGLTYLGLSVLTQGCADFGSSDRVALVTSESQTRALVSAPDLILTSRPATITASSSATFGFGSSDASASFWCSLDGASAQVCFNPVALNLTSTGDHTFSVYSINKEGIKSNVVSHSWNYNPTSISAQIATTLTPFSKLQNLNIAFSGSYVGGLSNLECRLDGADYAPCTSPKAVSVSTEGAHQFYVRAVGNDGTRSAPAIANWTSDFTMPSASVTTEAIPNTSGYLLKYTMSSSDSSGIKNRTCQFAGGSVFNCLTSYEIQTGDGSIAQTFNFWVEDNAGNIRLISRTFQYGSFF